MKKILTIVMVLCMLSGLYVAPAMAIQTDSSAFAEAVAEFSDGQYAEFVELIALVRDLDDPNGLVAAYNAAFTGLSPEAQQRIEDEGFYSDDTPAVVLALANYGSDVSIGDFTDQQLLDLYPDGFSLDISGFELLLNSTGALGLRLDEAYPLAPEDVKDAVRGMKKLLNTTLISGVFEIDIFEPVSAVNTDLVLDDTELSTLIGVYNDTLTDDVLGDSAISAAIGEFVTYYNTLLSDDTDRSLIFAYLKDNGLVTIESSGGGGGGGGGVLPIEEPIVVPDPIDNPDPQDALEEESAVEVVAEVDSEDGSASAEVQVDGDTVDDALEKALEAADALEEDGRTLQPVLVLEAVTEVAEGDVLVEVDMSLPLAELQQAEEEGVRIAIKTDIGTVVFNTEDIINGTEFKEDGSPQLELSMTVVDSATFVEEGIPADALIVDMSFEINGTVLEHFAAPIKVKIPYTLKEGENPEDVTVFWIDETGTPVAVGGSYNPATGMVTFLTDHFSEYFAKTATREFSDVAAGHWGHSYITNMAGKGFISGYTDGTFRPNGEITRAEFVTILAQMYVLHGEVSELEFADVSADDWYAPYVAAGYDKQIVAGKSATEFDPNGKISRQEAAAMLSNVIGMNGFLADTDDSQMDQFADQVDISSWACTSVTNCYAYGLFSGRTDGRFAPKENLSRAEAATMLFNLQNLK
jgi:hypothetical protein